MFNCIITVIFKFKYIFKCREVSAEKLAAQFSFSFIKRKEKEKGLISCYM